VRQHGDEIDSDREKRAPSSTVLRESGMRGFYALPLNDDTGAWEFWALRARSRFSFHRAIELLQVLAAQATVALRNAQMYKEVPFISVLEPVLAAQAQILAMEKKDRRWTMSIRPRGCDFLIVFPLPMRVDGDATGGSGPARSSAAGFEGTYRRKVLVHEGDVVKRGQILAEMDAWELRSAVAAAEAKIPSRAFADESCAGHKRRWRGRNPACPGRLLEGRSGQHPGTAESRETSCADRRHYCTPHIDTFAGAGCSSATPSPK